jgi:hypothetical protein
MTRKVKIVKIAELSEEEIKETAEKIEKEYWSWRGGMRVGSSAIIVLREQFGKRKGKHGKK